MSGHSKWATIKRQKARVDAAKGKTFAKISRAIIMAARSGVPDPAGNFQLRTAIEKAKAAGIPNDNIDRAIAKGAGKLGADGALEEIRYEGYGPGGVAILIEALTDNRNRTAADLRAAFSKRGGNLGEMGCVGWMFEQKGVVRIWRAGSGKLKALPIDEESLLEDLLDLGAETYELVELDEEIPGAEVFSNPLDLEELGQRLAAKGYQVMESELRWIPSNSVEVTDAEQAGALLRMMEALEDLEDVQSVTGNFEMADELVEVIEVE
ncbi:MAG: YebC/PmpR family DNA-binding transcriptional regulator [Pegethrix bostrychoides GSE-TBD4-15B]|jgi:YebC/PmpR family DNA-binding regulatory protein|uniref:Probable transcriptional regulatory protein KME07_13930 n=1 Tax=Pegethrix bostrychoides GSE-TBD4-15B TaxID=2839662 RepID=A0A951PBK3_9CYAN|nr:YebC/PmpR family DNA-binding transcriptional regulator [Pegethrix bostrychoides GSE-TBD4-15B]